MENPTQLTETEVANIIKTFPLQPTYNKLIITLNMTESSDDLITSDVGMAEEQYVVATGLNSPIPAGAKVLIDFKQLMVKVPSETDQYQMTTQIEVDPVEVDGVGYAFVSDRAIKAYYV
jgi:hypothetical protein